MVAQGGSGGIVLKNKLKNFKAAIKQWSKVEGNINAKKILNIQQKLNEVENLASHRILSNQELKDRNSLQQEFWNASNAFESLMTQKSRSGSDTNRREAVQTTRPKRQSITPMHLKDYVTT